MPCTAQADTVFRLLSSTVIFIPVAAVLLLLARWVRRARARGLRVWTIGLTAAALGISIAFLLFGGVSVNDGEQATSCPAAGDDVQPVHCWRSGSTLEMNAYGRRPLDLASINRLARSLAATKQDATLYEAILLDTTDSTVAAYSNARLFISIHINRAPSPTPRGTTVYWYKPQDAPFAQAIEKQLVPLAGTQDDGTRHENFYVVRHTTMPAVLIETAFITNPGDVALLRQPAFWQNVAQGIANGVKAYAGAPSANALSQQQ